VALANRRSPGCLRLQLIGEGPERVALEAHAERLGLAGCVQLCGLTADVGERLRAADLFVLPSRAEGLSNALLEAMAHGLPVVVSDVPGNVDVVDDGVDGLVSPVGDPAALADRLEQLVADEPLRRRLGTAARAKIEAVYDLELVVDSYEALYATLTAGVTGHG
jgi:glycosyltransferase involved in cell wall biosynthesis